jgi:hypothetical protein
VINPEFIRQAEQAIQFLPKEVQAEASESLALLQELVDAINTKKYPARGVLSALLSLYLELLSVNGLEQEGATVLMTKAFVLAQRAADRRAAQAEVNPGLSAVH